MLLRYIAPILLLIFISSGAGQDSSARVGSLRQLQFSPDGRYVLAQDDSEITVLSVEPFAMLFRIPAQYATDAKFTPDAGSVVFASSTTRVDSRKIALAKSAAQVEQWSIADRTRVRSTKLPALVCGTQKLSPDGGVLACLDLNGTLHFFDVASGQTMFEKKHFAAPFEIYGRLTPIDSESASLEFSPDGHFIIVRSDDPDGPDFAWSVREKNMVKLSGPLKAIKSHGAVFIAPDRVFLSGGENPLKPGEANCKVLAFPSGQLLSESKVPFGTYARATDPGFVIVRHFGSSLPGRSSPNRSAVVELSTGQVSISETSALDAFGRLYVAERGKGEVGLYEFGKDLKASCVLAARP
jgi:WD40 repeat protein